MGRLRLRLSYRLLPPAVAAAEPAPSRGVAELSGEPIEMPVTQLPRRAHTYAHGGVSGWGSAAALQCLGKCRCPASDWGCKLPGPCQLLWSLHARACAWPQQLPCSIRRATYAIFLSRRVRLPENLRDLLTWCAAQEMALLATVSCCSFSHRVRYALAILGPFPVIPPQLPPPFLPGFMGLAASLMAESQWRGILQAEDEFSYEKANK